MKKEEKYDIKKYILLYKNVIREIICLLIRKGVMPMADLQILRKKMEELIKEFQIIFDDKNYKSGMFFGYVFNEIVNFPIEDVLSAIREKTIELDQLQEEAKKRKLLQIIIEGIFKQREIWWKKYEEEKHAYIVQCATNLEPDEVLEAKSLEQIRDICSDAIFCCRFLECGSRFINGAPQQVLPKELEQYEKVRNLLFEMKESISKN